MAAMAAAQAPRDLGGALITCALSEDGQQPSGLAQHRRTQNVRVCTWISFASTVTTQMAAGPFIDIYMFKITGNNSMVGAVESVRGIAQLLMAPLLGMLADRVDRYRLVRLQALLHALPISALAMAIASDRPELLFFALPLFSVSNHLGNTVRSALLADNVEDGAQRTHAISVNFSMTYVGQATGPLLQIAVLLAMGGGQGQEAWYLPELRSTLLAGCAVYFFAEPFSLFFRRVAPSGSQPTESRPTLEAAEVGETDWRQQRVLKCCGYWGGVKKMWATPVAVEITYFFILLGSGMSTKFYPLFFARDFGLSPFGLCILGAAEPLTVAALSRSNPCITRRFGRARTALLFMCVSPVLLLGVIEIPYIFATAPMFVMRTATARAYIPLFQAIVATCVPTQHRGKFAAMSAFRMSFFSASAFLGAWLADSYGSYRPAFFITALWQLACIVLFLPVLRWLPSKSDS